MNTLRVRNLKLFSCLLLLLIPFIRLDAQCFKGNTSVGPSEYLAYDISYNLGPTWSNIALVTLVTTQEMLGGKEVLHMKINGKTYPMYDHLFKVRDSYESWINPQTWETIKFLQYTVHNKNTILLSQYFYPAMLNYSFTYKLNNKAVDKGQVTVENCIRDMVSAAYFPRTLDLEKLLPGTVIPVSTVFYNNPVSLQMVAAGKGIIETGDGKKYICSKFTIKTTSKIYLVKEGSDIVVWLTADNNKVPVLIEAELIIGSVKFHIKEAKGLRNPNSALLTK
ncbi:MAG: DUF3108 domain-containing protein [Bacteroidales bacterium]